MPYFTQMMAAVCASETSVSFNKTMAIFPRCLLNTRRRNAHLVSYAAEQPLTDFCLLSDDIWSQQVWTNSFLTILALSGNRPVSANWLSYNRKKGHAGKAEIPKGVRNALSLETGELQTLPRNEGTGLKLGQTSLLNAASIAVCHKGSFTVLYRYYVGHYPLSEHTWHTRRFGIVHEGRRTVVYWCVQQDENLWTWTKGLNVGSTD
jgi:hypothetical protein